MPIIIADTHTHTLLCDHAYSTITQNCVAAREKGIRVLCSTEHGPAMLGAPTLFYFGNLSELPRKINDVTVLRGAEVNVMDNKGSLDIPNQMMANFEWVIASMHTSCMPPADEAYHTEAWLAIAENPDVHVIGHSGDGRFPFDHEAVVPAWKKHGKVVEINSHSFAVRPNSFENCISVAKLCKQLEVPIVISSDAHFHSNIANFKDSLALLKSIDFPEKLILNADYTRFAKFVNAANGKEIIADYY